MPADSEDYGVVPQCNQLRGREWTDALTSVIGNRRATAELRYVATCRLAAILVVKHYDETGRKNGGDQLH